MDLEAWAEHRNALQATWDRLLRDVVTPTLKATATAHPRFRAEAHSLTGSPYELPYLNFSFDIKSEVVHVGGTFIQGGGQAALIKDPLLPGMFSYPEIPLSEVTVEKVHAVVHRFFKDARHL